MFKLVVQSSLLKPWQSLPPQEKWEETTSLEEADALLCQGTLQEDALLKNPLMPQIVIDPCDSEIYEFSLKQNEINDLPPLLDGLGKIINNRQTLQDKNISYEGDLFHTVLAFIWTRGGSLQAHFSHKLPFGYGYPLIKQLCQTNTPPSAATQKNLLPPEVSILAHLEKLKLLTSTIVERAHACPSCASLNVILRDGCSECHSPHIEKYSIIHHFKCAYQAAQHHFLDPESKQAEYICPHCNKELIHFGVDYDKPGEVFLCQNCNHESSDSTVVGRCLNCQFSFQSDDMPQSLIKDYLLTPLGNRVTLSTDKTIFSQLDHLSAEEDLVPFSVFLRCLKSLSSYEERYDLPSTVLSINFKTPTKDQESTLKTIGKTIFRTIRAGDFISCHNALLLIFLMGVKEQLTEKSIKHIQDVIKESFDEEICHNLTLEEFSPQEILDRQDS